MKEKQLPRTQVDAQVSFPQLLRKLTFMPLSQISNPEVNMKKSETSPKPSGFTHALFTRLNLIKESPQQGLTVEVEEPNDIINAAKKGNVVLLKKPLGGAVKNIKVVLESGEKGFNLTAKFLLDPGVKIGKISILHAPEMIFPKLPQSFRDAKLFYDPKEEKSGIMLTGEKGTKMFISAHKDLDTGKPEINISTRTPRFAKKIQKYTPPALPKNREDIESALSDISGVLKITMESIYPLVKEKVPDKKLVLSAPR